LNIELIIYLHEYFILQTQEDNWEIGELTISMGFIDLLAIPPLLLVIKSSFIYLRFTNPALNPGAALRSEITLYVPQYSCFRIP